MSGKSDLQNAFQIGLKVVEDFMSFLLQTIATPITRRWVAWGVAYVASGVGVGVGVAGVGVGVGVSVVPRCVEGVRADIERHAAAKFKRRYNGALMPRA